MLSDRSVDIYNIHGLVFCGIGSFVPIPQKIKLINRRILYLYRMVKYVNIKPVTL